MKNRPKNSYFWGFYGFIIHINQNLAAKNEMENFEKKSQAAGFVKLAN